MPLPPIWIFQSYEQPERNRTLYSYFWSSGADYSDLLLSLLKKMPCTDPINADFYPVIMIGLSFFTSIRH